MRTTRRDDHIIVNELDIKRSVRYGDELLAGVKVKKLSIDTTPTGAEQDTGWNLPTACLVLDVFVNVRVAEATSNTKTLDVGLLSSESGGDRAGFIDSIPLDTVGYKQPLVSFVVGGTETYIADCTYGALLRTAFEAGSNNAGDVGSFARRYHICNGTAISVVYKAGNTDFAEFRGDIYVIYMELP